MDDTGDDPFKLVGTVLGERYEVLSAVARGGFGVVYRARQVALDRLVAVKVLDGLDRFSGKARASFLDRFRQEARTLAALNHPAVVRVIDYGVVTLDGGDVPWMALDWIEGRTLEDDLSARKGEGRSPKETLDLLRPALEALACAHDAGVTHRDLKPANLMLVQARRGECGLRVIDFGIAKVAPEELDPGSGITATRSEGRAFSPLYAAPEQVVSTRTGPWTDVHALGLIVTEVLTGQRAYRSGDGAGLLQEVLSATRPTPSQKGVMVGPWEVVLARALAVAVDARPSTAAKLLRELESSVEEAEGAWHASSGRMSRSPLAETAEAPLLATHPISSPSPPPTAVSAAETEAPPLQVTPSTPAEPEARPMQVTPPTPIHAVAAVVPMAPRPRVGRWVLAAAALVLVVGVAVMRARSSAVQSHPTQATLAPGPAVEEAVVPTPPVATQPAPVVVATVDAGVDAATTDVLLPERIVRPRPPTRRPSIPPRRPAPGAPTQPVPYVEID